MVRRVFQVKSYSRIGRGIGLLTETQKKEVIMFNSRMFKRTIIETPTHQTGRSAMGPNPRNLRGRAKCAVLGFTAMIVLLTASPAFGGVAAPTTASLNYETAVGSGFNSPYATAVDKSGNVFVADVLGNKVYEIVAVNGTVSASSTVKPLGSFTSARSVAIAPNGDLYVSAVINYFLPIAQSLPSAQPYPIQEAWSSMPAAIFLSPIVQATFMNSLPLAE
jgi:hypothetical protein